MLDSQSKNIEELLTKKNIRKFTFSFIFIVILIKVLFFILFLTFDYIESVNAIIWPIAEFFIIPIEQIETIIFRVIMPIVITLIFYISLKSFLKNKLSLSLVILVSILLIVSLNLMNGIYLGLQSPFLHFESAYTQLQEIDNLLTFIANYELDQIAGGNAQYLTHPVGAKIAFYLIYKLVYFPSLMSITTGIISTALSGFFLYHILISRNFEKNFSLNITFLFLILPAIQIFYLANLYALVSTSFLGTFYFYLHGKRTYRIIGTIIFLTLSASLTFMVVFILIVLIFDTFINKRDKEGFIELILILVALGLIYLFSLYVLRYDYINSFMIASNYENPGGFRLFSDPIDYFFTRVENIFEIIIFFGPLLLILFWRGFKILYSTSKRFYYFTLFGILSLLILFALGVYKTGETARSANFIYLFLIIPVIFYLKNSNVSQKEFNRIFILIYLQTTIMQFMGWYVW